MAVATLMYAPGTIEDAMTPDERKELWSVDADVLKRTLAPYPKLLAAVFPVQPPLHKSSAEKQDVTLYDLLKVKTTVMEIKDLTFSFLFFPPKGAVPLKINQIFKWQSTNNLRHDITVHGEREINDFFLFRVRVPRSLRSSRRFASLFPLVSRNEVLARRTFAIHLLFETRQTVVCLRDVRQPLFHRWSRRTKEVLHLLYIFLLLRQYR